VQRSTNPLIDILLDDFPIQHEIQELQNELNAFNERIAELEDEGHRGHAMEVAEGQRLDFARQIDELRCLLVESAAKHAPDGRVIIIDTPLRA
jgi:hypothetical protein